MTFCDVQFLVVRVAVMDHSPESRENRKSHISTKDFNGKCSVAIAAGGLAAELNRPKPIQRVQSEAQQKCTSINFNQSIDHRAQPYAVQRATLDLFPAGLIDTSEREDNPQNFGIRKLTLLARAKPLIKDDFK